MKLIDDWKRLAPKLWSVRLSLLSAFAAAVDASMEAYATGNIKIVVIAVAATSLAASVARIVAQPSVTGNGSE